MKYLILCWEFFKTGLFSVGGGLATLPFLSKMGEKYGWFTQKELANMLAVSESTPGPIGVNMATYVGNTAGGFLAGCLAVLSLVLPSYVIILLVSRVMQRYSSNSLVQGAMTGLRPASVGMIGAAVLGVLKSVLLNEDALLALQWSRLIELPSLILFAVLTALYIKFNKLHPVVILAIGAVAGIVLQA